MILRVSNMEETMNTLAGADIRVLEMDELLGK